MEDITVKVSVTQLHFLRPFCNRRVPKRGLEYMGRNIRTIFERRVERSGSFPLGILGAKS